MVRPWKTVLIELRTDAEGAPGQVGCVALQGVVEVGEPGRDLVG